MSETQRMTCDHCGEDVRSTNVNGYKFVLSEIGVDAKEPVTFDCYVVPELDETKVFCSKLCVALFCAPNLKHLIKKQETMLQYVERMKRKE